jgi:hypothetical protein
LSHSTPQFKSLFKVNLIKRRSLNQGSAQALISEGQFFSYTHIETKEKCMVIVDDITYIKNRVNGIVVFVFYWPIGKQLRLQGKS